MQLDPRLTDGVLGKFWILSGDTNQTLDLDEAIPGHAQHKEGAVQVRLMEPDKAIEQAFAEWGRIENVRDAWLVGLTEAGLLILPEVHRLRRSLNLGGARPSVRTYSGPAVITGADVKAISTKVKGVVVTFPHPEWAGFQPVSIAMETSKPWGISVTATSTKARSFGSVNELRLSVAGNYSNNTSRRLVSVVPQFHLNITGKPRPLRTYVEVAVRVQDLISCAYDQLVPATAASATTAESNAVASGLWHQTLGNNQDSQLAEDPDPSLPYFRLSDLGPSALARWVKVTEHFPDAAAAVRVRDRVRRSHSSRTLQLGAAIELYVTQCIRDGRAGRGVPQWADKSKQPAKGGATAGALARHAGRDFAEFVGDATRWGVAFTDAYNGEKHPLARSHDLAILNWSAEILLAVTLLNRTGASHRASQSLLQSSSLRERARELRDILNP